MKRFNLLILCLFITSFATANNDFFKENSFQGKNEKTCFTKDAFKKAKETGFTYTYIGSDGCTFTISVGFNVNEKNGHVDYTQIYMETGCGNGQIFNYYGWSNYIDSSITDTHLKARTTKGQEIIDNPNFIKQFNSAVEAHIR